MFRLTWPCFAAPDTSLRLLRSFAKLTSFFGRSSTQEGCRRNTRGTPVQSPHHHRALPGWKIAARSRQNEVLGSRPHHDGRAGEDNQATHGAASEPSVLPAHQPEPYGARVGHPGRPLQWRAGRGRFPLPDIRVTRSLWLKIAHLTTPFPPSPHRAFNKSTNFHLLAQILPTFA